MARLVFGEDEPKSLRRVIVDLVCDHVKGGHDERKARCLSRDDVIDAYKAGKEWASAAVVAALDIYIVRSLRGKMADGTKVYTKNKRGRVRRDYAIDRQYRLPLMAMTYYEAELAIVAQEKKRNEFDERITRLKELVSGLKMLRPDALTLGDAAEQCGQTRELVDLSALLGI